MNEQLICTLQELSREQKTIYLWFRDDDVDLLSPKLEVLLQLFRANAVPLLLAVIPKTLIKETVERIKSYRNVLVGQHGYSHENYSPIPGVPSELCAARGVTVVLQELLCGRECLRAAFGKIYTDIFIPPFFEMDSEIKDEIEKRGYAGFSSWWTNTVTTAGTPELNIQVDFVDWNHAERYAGPAFVEEQLLRECILLRRHPTARQAAIGVVLHHELLDGDSIFEIKALFLLAKQFPNVILSDVLQVMAFVSGPQFIQLHY